MQSLFIPWGKISAKSIWFTYLNIKKCRELLSSSGNKRLDFDISISLSDEDCSNLYGISMEQIDFICFMINGQRNSKHSVRTAISVLLTKLRTGSSSILEIMLKVFIILARLLDEPEKHWLRILFPRTWSLTI